MAFCLIKLRWNVNQSLQDHTIDTKKYVIIFEMPSCVAVAQGILDPIALVRIQARHPANYSFRRGKGDSIWSLYPFP